MLLEHGADVDATTASGETALGQSFVVFTITHQTAVIYFNNNNNNNDTTIYKTLQCVHEVTILHYTRITQ